MATKDVVFQVSQETADVMEEISEQLFDETQARFDEIVEAIEESVRKIGELYETLMDHVGNSGQQAVSNQETLLCQFGSVLDALRAFREDVQGNNRQTEAQTQRLLEMLAEVPQLIHGVSVRVSEAAETANTMETTLLQAVGALAEDLKRLHELDADIARKLKENDSREQMAATQSKLSAIEGEIKENSATLSHCNRLIDQILDCSKNLLVAHEKTADQLQGLTEENRHSTKALMDKLSELSASLETLSQRQLEIMNKQSKMEQDIQYLKLPFFKRWFKKGG